MFWKFSWGDSMLYPSWPPPPPTIYDTKIKKKLPRYLVPIFKCLKSIYKKSFHLIERVTKIENIKTDSTKILRPTHFSGSKDIMTDRFFVGLNLRLFFFQIRLVGLKIYLLLILENKTEALKTDNRVMYTTYIRIMLKTAKC